MSESDMESVRLRPAVYLGGTDEFALHKLPEEILNNALAEAVTKHADLIEVVLKEDGSIVISDNGRGIPVDYHPKFPEKSAVEVIFTMLHSSDASEVTASVVNALSDWLWVEVVRNKTLHRQAFSKGKPTSKLVNVGPANGRRGTTVCFLPDPEIFGRDVVFNASMLYEMVQSKAKLHESIEIRWFSEVTADDKGLT